MIYDIVYKEEDQMYHMDSKAEIFISNHLVNIGDTHNIEMGTCLSETHALGLLECNGIIVNLLKEDGSWMGW